jgi:hypothetical protein
MAQGQILVTNGDNSDDYVTVNDLNMAGGPVVVGWDKKRLNATDRDLPAAVELDGSGLANVRWYAERTDDPSKNNSKTESSRPMAHDRATFWKTLQPFRPRI